MRKRRRAKSSSEYEWERCVVCNRKAGYSFTIIRGVGSFCERCMYEKQEAMLIRNQIRAMGGSACGAPVGIERYSKEACVESVYIDGIEVKMAIVHSCKSLTRLVEWLKPRVPRGLMLAFRGQYKDHGQRPLKTTRKIRLLPSILRSRRQDISADMMGAELRAWVKALADEYPGYDCPIVVPKLENGHVRNKLMFAWLRTREDFLAIAMHYGYPTTYLDVSSDLKVAVWFAIHRYFLKDGLVRHKTVHAKGTNKFLWPSVYVLVADSKDLIDIRRADPSSSRTNRSHRQSAVALAYGSVLGADPYSGLITMMTDKSASVIPWLVIKLSPEFDWEQMGLAGHEHYFPDIKHDRTYAALLRAKVPRLAVYATV